MMDTSTTTSCNSSNNTINDINMDTLTVLLQKEQTEYKTVDYLHSSRCSCSCHPRRSKRPKHETTTTTKTMTEHEQYIRRKWRKICCQWGYQVADFFGMEKEIVAIAMNLMDRYHATTTTLATFSKQQQEHCWTGKKKTKDRFQLVAMTCLYVAIKLNHTPPLCIAGTTNSTLETISLLSEQPMNVQDIQTMEVELLQTLEWKVHPPTPQAFLKLFMEVINNDDMNNDMNNNNSFAPPPATTVMAAIFERANFFIEEATLGYYDDDSSDSGCHYCNRSSTFFRPSTIALSALWNAMEMFPISTTEKLLNLILSLPSGRMDPLSTIRTCRQHLARIFWDETEPEEEQEQDEDDHYTTTTTTCDGCHISNNRRRHRRRSTTKARKTTVAIIQDDDEEIKEEESCPPSTTTTTTTTILERRNKKVHIVPSPASVLLLQQQQRRQDPFIV